MQLSSCCHCKSLASLLPLVSPPKTAPLVAAAAATAAKTAASLAAALFMSRLLLPHPVSPPPLPAAGIHPCIHLGLA
jgi:hypothetical protein